MFGSAKLTWESAKGPRAFLSIASQPGIEWLESKVQYPAMRESLHRFARTVTMLFKQNAGPTPANFPASEPAEDVAWSYVNGESGSGKVSERDG